MGRAELGRGSLRGLRWQAERGWRVGPRKGVVGCGFGLLGWAGVLGFLGWFSFSNFNSISYFYFKQSLNSNKVGAELLLAF